MCVSELTASNQNYLKAIWSLGEWTTTPVSKTAISGRVGVKMSTVSDAVRKLHDLGLINDTPYGSVELTETGRGYAVAMVRRHLLIETFLMDALGYRWDQVHAEADVLEHAVSDFMIERIDEFLNHPLGDPHGDPIPTAEGTIELPAAEVLADVTLPARVRVERLSDEDPYLLQHFAEMGLGIGSVLTVNEGPKFSESFIATLSTTGVELTLGAAAQNSVWVSNVR